MSFSTSPSARYPELDGVRGLAIALTVACNTIMVHGPGLGEKLWAAFANGGWIGVQLFFVLSGFLITDILIGTKSDSAYFRNFYARRALRILPAYFLVIGLLGIGLPGFGPSLAHPPACYWLFVSNFCIAHSGWGNSFVGIMWSLAVEEHFYLVWPLVVAFVAAPRLAATAAAIIAGSLLLRYVMTAAGAATIVTYTITPTRIDGIAAGALVAIVLRGGAFRASSALQARLGQWMAGSGLAIMAAIVILTRSFDYERLLVQTVGYTALTLAAAGFVLLLVADQNDASPWRRWMRWPPLVAVGFYSYAIYLYHPIVRGYALKLLPFDFGALSASPGIALAAQVAFTAVIGLVTFLLAVASYHLFEKRFLALRRYFPRSATTATVTAGARAARS